MAVPDHGHVLVPSGLPFVVEVAVGRRGLPAQRNLGLELALRDCDVITFLDDDFLAGRGYLEKLAHGFADNPDWAVATGEVVADGVTGPGLSFEQGCAMLAAAEQFEAANERVVGVTERAGAYGCNMSIRACLVGNLRFDERLVLYGWQEDTDFSMQLGKRGRSVAVAGMIGVHLGVKSGRVSGVRFGYSQIANPIYLSRKGTVPWPFTLRLVGRNVLANLAKSAWPEAYVDRLGRLRGNLLAFRHVISGRIEPEYILRL